MNLKRMPVIGFMFLIAAMIICFLYWQSDKTIHKNNSFVRLFPPHFLYDVQVIELPKPMYKIAGLSSEKIFLWNPYNPLKIEEVDYRLGNKKEVQLSLINNEKVAWKVLNAAVDFPHVYLTEGITPNILHANYNNGMMVKENMSFPSFAECLPIDSKNYILKTYDPQLKQNILLKHTLDSVKNKEDRYILEKQVDGIFCTDGQLLYNKERSIVIYVYRYRNEYISLSPQLDLLLKGRTIDTVSKAKLEVQQLQLTDSSTKYVLTKRPLTVNIKSYSYGDELFIQSNLASKNEDITQFPKKTVIDTYSLINGDYRYSFNIPLHLDSKMKDFAVYGNTLVALYGHQVITFKMKFPD